LDITAVVNVDGRVWTLHQHHFSFFLATRFTGQTLGLVFIFQGCFN